MLTMIFVSAALEDRGINSPARRKLEVTAQKSDHSQEPGRAGSDADHGMVKHCHEPGPLDWH
jgi:hypothetical protein